MRVGSVKAEHMSACKWDISELSELICMASFLYSHD
jgi:hypothetical protein